MAPRILYHGSSVRIDGMLHPHKPDDSSLANSHVAVYATDRKDIALGMALNGKDTRAFGDYEQVPFQLIVVRGMTRKKYVYLYVVSAAGFRETPKGSHQWISKRRVPILRMERIAVADLGRHWRRATPEERRMYYRTKPTSAPRR